MPSASGSNVTRPRGASRVALFHDEPRRRDAETRRPRPCRTTSARRGPCARTPCRRRGRSRARGATNDVDRCRIPRAPSRSRTRPPYATTETIAVFAPSIRVCRRVGPLAARELLQRVARRAAERRGLEHRARLAPPSVLVRRRRPRSTCRRARARPAPRRGRRECPGSCPAPRSRCRSARERRRRTGARTRSRRARRRSAPTAGVARATEP